MKKKTLRALSVMMALCMLLVDILYTNTPVQAAGDSVVAENTTTVIQRTRKADRDNDLYKWRQAKTLDDLKQYVDAERNQTWNFKGTWIPIIIVAEYPDGTCYYMNRNTKTATFRSDDAVIPYLNEATYQDSVGVILQSAMHSYNEFYTRGDMGAMHMFYHGEVQSDYDDGYVKAEAWSLTLDKDIEDPLFGQQTTTAPKEVFGVRTYKSYVTMDQNPVNKWKTKDALPVTQDLEDGDTTYRMAWTFVPYKNGTFLISCPFSWGLNYDLDDDANVYSLTMGCALKGSYRYRAPDPKNRDKIDTPSRAAATIYDDDEPGNTKQGEDMYDAIIEQYEYKYDEKDEKNTRAKFRIFVGQREDGEAEMNSESMSGTKRVGRGNHLAEGKTITIEKGGVMIIPSGSFFYLDGTIVNKGTLIVGENSVVTASRKTYAEQTGQGSIWCQDGGTLLVMKGAKLYLENNLTLMKASMIVKGSVYVDQSFYMDNSQIQIEDGGGVVLAAVVLRPALLMQKTSFDYKLIYDMNEGRSRAFFSFKYGTNNKVLLKPQARLVTKYRGYEDVKTYFPDRDVVGWTYSGETRTATRRNLNTIGNETSKTDLGQYYEDFTRWIEYKY